VKFKNIIQVTILIAALSPITVFAAPSITSVTGTNGQITINGSGFGNGPNVVFFDDFEKGTNGALVGSSAPAIGGYGKVDSGALYSTSYHNSGSKAFYNNLTNGMATAPIPLPVGTKEVFCSYNNYVPSSSPLSGQDIGLVNWKMLWLLGSLGENGTTTSPTIFLVMNDINNIHLGANQPDVNVITASAWTSSTFVKGEWNFYSMWYKLGSSNNGGSLITYKNSASKGTTGSNTANVTTSATTNDLRFVHLNGYARTTPGASLYFDDVYVATGPNARARIEIGNASSYANCTKIAIATAVTWGASQVTATIRPGSFQTGASAYLYLIDAAGNVSNGQQITVGSGSSATAPQAPSSLQVVAK